MIFEFSEQTLGFHPLTAEQSDETIIFFYIFLKRLKNDFTNMIKTNLITYMILILYNINHY